MEAGDEFLDEDGNIDWDALKRALQKIPDQEFRRLVVELGLMEDALSALTEVAQNSTDPVQRERARQVIGDYGLGLLLIDESDDPLEDL